MKFDYPDDLDDGERLFFILYDSYRALDRGVTLDVLRKRVHVGVFESKATDFDANSYHFVYTKNKDDITMFLHIGKEPNKS
ncbi:hypothetical protein J4476_04750 [Candidatus Woesearchaeota archaeon]|nr:MAG: hypothetical protein QT09_C0007G0093 [archaeon GW2011_AR18]MBS3161973.1 hypothetical protein [Candidatus Woesearchaeota archaeon]HIH25593.1 hypothetical protein [Nanoarchaeota archaeon]